MLKLNLEFIKYLCSVLIYGSNGIVASHIDLASYEIVFMRSVISVTFLLALFKLTGGKFTFMNHRKDFCALLISALSMGVSAMFLFEAYSQVGVGVATLLFYCGPVFVMALSPIMFGEKLTRKVLLGFGIVFLGQLLVNGRVVVSGGNLWGIFCGIMSAVTYVSMVSVSKKCAAITGLEKATLQLIIAMIPPTIFLAATQGFHISIPSGSWPALLLLGIFNIGIGTYLFYTSINFLPIQTVAVCGYLEPLAAVILSAVLLGEQMTALQILGAVLIIGGAIFCELSHSSSPALKSNKEN